MPDPTDTARGSSDVTVTDRGSDRVDPSENSAAESSSGESTPPTIKYSLNKQPNELRNYSTFNSIFTLACLTTDEINNPNETYRVTDPQVTILRSGGGAQGKALTAFETASTQLEYFIDNVEIDTIIAPTSATRTSNATTISFEVTEPYSMGLFLQTLQLAAKNAQGSASDYLKAPYALILEFIGYTGTDTVASNTVTRRVLPIKFSSIEFDVDAGGSKYRISAFAWNEQAQSDSIQTINEDTKLQGKTVRELLQTATNSLTNKINQKIRDGLQENTAIIPDEYVIVFPEDIATSSVSRVDAARSEASDNATVSTERAPTGIGPATATRSFKGISADSVGALPSANAIGASAMLTDSLSEAATVPFGLPEFTYREPEDEDEDFTPFYDNGRIQIDGVTGEFTFPGGSNIEKMIEEIVILSQYGQDAATQISADKEGNIPWFRIQTQTFSIPDEESRIRTGENPKVYVYMVVPYEVHSSTFTQARTPSVGIEEKSIVAVKEYNYIYTGKNEDVLDFELNFNIAFFQALSPNLGNTTGDARTRTNQASRAVEQNQLALNQGNTADTGEASVTNRESNIANQGAQEGGDSRSSAAIQAARNFNEAIVNGVDLITLDLKIMGDPYYIADTGIGNYNAPAGALPSITRDGTMNYQTREVDVVLNFRTPIDYNEDGGMNFPQDTLPVKTFSGLYKVNMVRNRFSGNAFEQTLQMIRRPNQELEGTPDAIRPIVQSESKEGATSGQSSTSTGGNANANSQSTGTANSASSTTASQLVPASGTASPINEERASVGEGVTRIDITQIQRNARNEAIREVLDSGGTVQEAEAAGQRAGNLAGADALRNVNLGEQ